MLKAEGGPLSSYAFDKERGSKKKCSMQSEVMCDLENMDVMLTSYPRDNYEVQGDKS